MNSKYQKLYLAVCLVLALLVLCAPTDAEAARVIFFAPRSRTIHTGQILSSHAKEKPCEKCHMRDHRGHCRRMLSFNADGVKC